MNEIHALYGSGGYAREVMPLLRGYVNAISQNDLGECVFIDDFIEKGLVVNGIGVLSFVDFIEKYENYSRNCCIAIADSKVRRKLTEDCKKNNVTLITIQALNSVVMDDVSIGEGSILSPFVTVTSNVRIGSSFHANLYSYVAHDCVIGDFVTFAPGVKCNGNVLIEDDVYIGTGAIIHPGTKNKPLIIGQNSKIAAGVVVTKDVSQNTTVIGHSARPLDRAILRAMRRY